MTGCGVGLYSTDDGIADGAFWHYRADLTVFQHSWNSCRGSGGTVRADADEDGSADASARPACVRCFSWSYDHSADSLRFIPFPDQSEDAAESIHIADLSRLLPRLPWQQQQVWAQQVEGILSGTRDTLAAELTVPMAGGAVCVHMAGLARRLESGALENVFGTAQALNAYAPSQPMPDQTYTLSDLEDLSGLGRWTYDVQRRVFWTSAVASRILGLGYEDREVSFDEARDITVSRIPGAFPHELEDVISGRLPRKKTLTKILTPSGQTKFIETTFRCVFDRDGRARQVQGVTRDIDSVEPKINEARSLKARLDTALVHGGISVWEVRYVDGRAEVAEGGSLVKALTGTPSVNIDQVDLPYRTIMAEQEQLRSKGDLESFTEEFPVKALDGRTHWIRGMGWRISPPGAAVPHYEGIALDITPEKQASLLLEGVMAGAAVGLVTVDEWGKIQSINRFAEEMYGYSPGELSGKSLMLLAPESARGRHGASFEKLRHTGQFTNLGTTPSEAVGLRKDGTEFPVEATLSAIQVNDRTLLVASIYDITERKNIERSAREGERLLRQISGTIDEVFWTIDPKSRRFTYLSSGFERITGLEPTAISGNPNMLLEHVAEEDRPRVTKVREAAFETGTPFAHEYRLRRADGSLRWVASRGFPVVEEDGSINLFVGAIQDITDRKQAEEALRESEERFQLSMEATRDGIWDWDKETDGAYFSPAYYKMFGYEVGEFPAHFNSWMERLHPDDRENALKINMDCVEGRCETFEVEYRMQTKTGAWRWILARGKSVVRDPQGRSLRLVGTNTDITERKNAELAAREQAKLLRMISENIDEAFWIVDLKSEHIVYANNAATRISGQNIELVGLQVGASLPTIIEEDREQVAANQTRGYSTGQPYTNEYRIIHPDGTLRWIWSRSFPVTEEDGSVDAFIGVAQDITERKKAERTIRDGEQLLQQISSIIDEVFWMADAKSGLYTYFSPAFNRITGIDPEVVKANPKVLLDMIVEDDVALFKRVREEAIATRKPAKVEYRLRRPDGSVRWIAGRIFPSYDDAGNLKTFIGVAQDITDRKEAEAKFLQAQKLETVGHLTGGVAHDFNNLLMAIQFGTEFARDASRLGIDPQEQFDMVLDATQRGADLVRRLSVFARQQDLDPKVIDPSSLVMRSMRLIRTALPEFISTEIEIADHISPINVDAGQMENALLNLAINARDAMPDGGNLIFSVRNAGLDRVEVSVTDTGMGMSAEVRAKALEPFFTTKAVGKGTGLGLSMVYGFVTQSGGGLEIESEEGRGTTIRMWFPAAVGAANAMVRRRAMALQGGLKLGKVMLVDDEMGVRKALEALLRPRSDTLVVATTGPEGMDAIERADRVDLLISDVVLPGGLSGFDLADAVTRKHASCRVLLISGYSADALRQRGGTTDYAMLQKPFSPQTLLTKLDTLSPGN